jgi:hypothetical protein
MVSVEDLRMKNGKIKVTVLAVASLLIVVSFFVVVAGLLDDGLSEDGLQSVNGQGAVDFTCHAGTEYAYVFPVPIDLSDGMDSDEAITVAGSLYESNMNQTNYEVKSVESTAEGSWTVYLLWGAITPKGEVENHSHFYNVHINATTRTVDYDRCY